MAIKTEFLIFAYSKSKLINLNLKKFAEISPEEERIFETPYYRFEQTALEVFHFQRVENSIYKSFIDHLKIQPDEINSLQTIPFLPVSFFKTHQIKTGHFEPEMVFESSGTTKDNLSRHYIKKWNLYQESFLRTFTKFYGPVNDYCIIGLLPSYLERKNSSLVSMVDTLISKSENTNSGFYLYDYEKVFRLIAHNELTGQKTLLIGVTFALLDFAESFQMKVRNTIVMETGGMKGRRKEMIRKEVHQILKERWGLENIHSEYGMTELLSQAYSAGEGIFNCPPWMRVLVRDLYNPMDIKYPTHDHLASGFLNVIDLANLYSCSFIATEDIGKVYKNGSFEVLGRGDTSMVRGCNLLVV